MPSSTFLNIPKDKQESLLSAAKEEFSNELYDNASINRIIKKCNIPRGSFYMYFSDKEDLYFYLLSFYKLKIQEVILENLKNNNGDIINMFQDVFKSVVKSIEKEENAKFFKNVILNMNYLMEHKVLIKHREDMSGFPKEVLSLVDTDKLNIKDEKTLTQMGNILFMMSIHELIEYIKCDNVKKETILTDYFSQLELLKKGFYKGE